MLRDGTLVATASTCCANPTPFDVETLSLRIRSDSATLSGNYGLSDRVDIGAAISLVRISIRGERVDTYRGERLLQASASSTASGVGDLVLRVKYNLMRSSGTGLAIGAETRLPTGDEENLLGTGKTAVKPRIIWSLENNGVAVDTELGYSFGGLSDELTYGGAITIVGAPRFMVIGELSGRLLQSVGRTYGDHVETSKQPRRRDDSALGRRRGRPPSRRHRRLQVESRRYLARRRKCASEDYHRWADRAVGAHGVDRIRVRRVTIWTQRVNATNRGPHGAT